MMDRTTHSLQGTKARNQSTEPGQVAFGVTGWRKASSPSHACPKGEGSRSSGQVPANACLSSQTSACKVVPRGPANPALGEGGKEGGRTFPFQ